MKKYINYIYAIVTVVSLVIAVIMGANYNTRRKAHAAETRGTATTIAELEKKDRVMIAVSSETIREGLANMGVLITQEYYFTQVEKYTKEKSFFSFITTSSEFMYSYDGAVLAGVDFSGIAISTNEDTKKITVKMPDSEIQAVTIDKSTFKIYSEKESIWNPLRLEDYNISLAEFEKAAKDKALSSGILERSDNQAKALVREFIASLPNMSSYSIEFA